VRRLRKNLFDPGGRLAPEVPLNLGDFATIEQV
jgi:hypothetical protein